MDLLTLVLIVVILAFVFGGPRYSPNHGNVFYGLACLLVLIIVLRLLGIF